MEAKPTTGDQDFRWAAPNTLIQRNVIVNKTPSRAPSAFKRSPSLETTLAYMGSNMSFLAKGEETGGCLALMEFHSRPGNEPPPHIHDWEDELYYLLEGRMEFYCDDEVLSVGAGEVAFLPQGKAHAFYIRSPIVKALCKRPANGPWDWTGISSTWANGRRASNCRTIKPRTACPTRRMPPGSRHPTASESCRPKRLQNCCRTIPVSELIRIRQRVETQTLMTAIVSVLKAAVLRCVSIFLLPAMWRLAPAKAWLSALTRPTICASQTRKRMTAFSSASMTTS
jgi:quercetin dioxygenase-like cupin family protein